MVDPIYLVSWPRSGSTLLRAILWQCFGIKSSSMYADSILERDGCRQLVGADPQARMVIKTHEHRSRLPRGTKSIYIVRDGREACISYWHYYRDILGDHLKTVNDIIRGDCMFGDWSAHVKDGKKQHAILHYEDLMPGTCGRVVMWLMEHLATEIGILPKQIVISDWESFKRADSRFFRSGTNETWREELVGGDLKLFYDLHGETMQKLGYLEEGANHALAATT